MSLCKHFAILAISGLMAADAAASSTRPAAPASPEMLSAKVTVDSSSAGYGPGPLTDGKWFAKGEEDPNDYGATRLGNGGNAWVSGEGPTEHWIRLDWAQPVTLDGMVIWWALPEWYPRAFRVEHLQGEMWIPVGDDQGWLAPIDRQSVIPLPSIQVQSIRLLQPASGGGTRPLMAAQEITVFNRGGEPSPLSGARRLSAAAYARLTPKPLMRNIARLAEECPGAAFQVAWFTNGTTKTLSSLADGNLEVIAASLADGAAAGIEWPVAHVIDGVSAVFGGAVFDSPGLAVMIHDGRDWRPMYSQQPRIIPERRRIEWSFEPIATTSVRLQMLGRGDAPVLAEMEVYRNLPASGTTWRDRFVAPIGLKQELLAAAGEPSFELLSTCALSMRTARALLGLKDTPREVGVSWDGTVEGRSRINFCIGPEQHRLADVPDTVRRELIDGWRPGVVIQGRINDLEIQETALVTPLDAQGSAGVLLVQITLRNLSETPQKTFIEAEAFCEQPGPVEFRDGMLTRGGQVVLISASPARVGGSTNAMCVDLELSPNGQQSVVFIEPQDPVAVASGIERYKSLAFDAALREFRKYWDDTLATSTTFEVPEPRINRMVKAVLAQCFVNADGDVMPYGSAPSVYEGSLFGIEESYPMLALAMFGFGQDAQRYLDGTYLTREFLAKKDEYKTLEDRHQQYRNGLQPHYAVSAYRFSRDTTWARQHMPLLRECADWTIGQRRKTMVPENGGRPLHWGLLPKWSYGGDIFDVQCYAFFANLCCWRGLVDTAWLLDELGETEAAKRYARESSDYRQAIDRAIESSYQKDQRPPFLPLRLYATKPDEQLDFYQLFAGCILDVEPFAIGSTHLRWITDYLEDDNRTLCLLPRFRHIGPGALDAIYGKGYFLTKLHEDSIREFLLAFYAYLAFNMDRDVFTSRESNVLYTSDLHARSSYRAAEISDPLPCGSAVALHLLRHMLVTEERAGAGGYSGNLLLLAGTPRAWFSDRDVIRIRNAPTHYGPVDLEVRSEPSQGRIIARLSRPTRDPCGTVRLRLRHPTGKTLQGVWLNDKERANFDPKTEWIVVPEDIGKDVVIVAHY